MTKLSPTEARRARRLLRVIQEFRKLDPDMQMPMAATFLLVALDEGISRSEVMDHLSVAGSTATRNLMGLMEKGRLGRPGHGLIEQEVNPEERRWRMHYLSPKGRVVLKSMLALLDGLEDDPPSKRRPPGRPSAFDENDEAEPGEGVERGEADADGRPEGDGRA